jgi:hypothetical protein
VQVLEQAFVGVIGRADPGRGRQRLLEAGNAQTLGEDDAGRWKESEAPHALDVRLGREGDKDFIADEIVVRLGPARRRVLDANDLDGVETLQPLEQDLGEDAFARPVCRVDRHRVRDLPVSGIGSFLGFVNRHQAAENS